MVMLSTTKAILAEIANGSKRLAVARSYRWALALGLATDWKTVNEAIIARWSISGLAWIKKEAWKP